MLNAPHGGQRELEIYTLYVSLIFVCLVHGRSADAVNAWGSWTHGAADAVNSSGFGTHGATDAVSS